MRLSAGGAGLWAWLAVLAILLFYFAAMDLILLVIQKRFKWLWLAAPALCLTYFMEQCFDMAVAGSAHTHTADRIVARFAALPDWSKATLCLAAAALPALLFRSIRHYERHRITPMSIKEAMDSLPAGILCYAPGERTLFVNRAMEDFCRRITGKELKDAEAFSALLFGGELIPPCKRFFAGDAPVIVLPIGTARKISESEIRYEDHTVRLLLALNITEEYRKTQELLQMREKVEKLEKRLRKVNREIVAMTVERETLAARVRIHDELGSNLLAIKRYLTNGGTEEGKAELMEKLHRSVSFLKNDTPSAPMKDDYELLHSMAARLGLTICVTGELPQDDPHKTIIANAIHECLTNTLRHAHGDELRVEMSGDGEWITAVFTNNGKAPEGRIVEKGGLKSLRELTEQASGSMTIETQPTFTLTVRLPKEVEEDV